VFLNSVGIILKKNELQPHKIIVLDKTQGKIECISKRSALAVGSVITYTLQQKGALHFLENSDLIYLPLSLAQRDMLFFHHVIELSYYFTHVGNSAHELFDQIALLYSMEHVDMTMQTKKIFLFKLLTSIGIVPEIDIVHTSFIEKLASSKIKNYNKIAVSIQDEKELDRWLWCCVWQHPYVNEFKTVHFLAENRIL